jgi:hypothetical protein
MCIATNNIKTVIMIYRFIDKTNLYLNEKINSDLLDGIKHTINVIEKKSNALDDEYIVKI